MLETFILPPQRHEQLTIFPVVIKVQCLHPYVLLADALASGAVTIEETGNGEVHRLVARNRSHQPVLALNGEQLVGAKRCCITSHSVLLAPRGTTDLPVADLALETSSPGTSGHAPGNDASTPAGAAEAYGSRRFGLSRHYGREVEPWLDAFPLLEGQLGMLAFLGRRFIGMDALGCPSLYAPLHPRLLAGYALAARDDETPPSGCPPPDVPEAEAFAVALEEARRIPSRTVGLGTYSVFRGLVRGGELLHEGHLVHVTALPREPGKE